MAQGKKVTEEEKERIKAVIYTDPTLSQSDIARRVKMPLTTVHCIMREPGFLDADKYEQARQEAKKQFIAKAFELALQTLDIIGDKVVSLKDAENLKKANIRDLTTALGTLYDKQALASGEATSIITDARPLPEVIAETENTLSALKKLTG